MKLKPNNEKIAWDTSFRRAFKRKARKNPHLRQRMLEMLELLSQDVFDPPLKTHKLRGQLEGLRACWPALLRCY